MKIIFARLLFLFASLLFVTSANAEIFVINSSPRAACSDGMPPEVGDDCAAGITTVQGFEIEIEIDGVLLFPDALGLHTAFEAEEGDSVTVRLTRVSGSIEEVFLSNIWIHTEDAGCRNLIHPQADHVVPASGEVVISRSIPNFPDGCDNPGFVGSISGLPNSAEVGETVAVDLDITGSVNHDGNPVFLNGCTSRFLGVTNEEDQNAVFGLRTDSPHNCLSGTTFQLTSPGSTTLHYTGVPGKKGSGAITIGDSIFGLHAQTGLTHTVSPIFTSNIINVTGGLEVSLRAPRVISEVDEEFTVEISVKNIGTRIAHDVMPPEDAVQDQFVEEDEECDPEENPECEYDDIFEAMEFISEPPMPVDLQPGETHVFEYRYRMAAKGEAFLYADMNWTSDFGNEVETTYDCAEDTSLNALSAQACQSNGTLRVILGGECKVTLMDSTPPVVVYRRSGITYFNEETGDEVTIPVACGADGQCTAELVQAGDFFAVETVRDPIDQTSSDVKNVGQEVKVTPDVEILDSDYNVVMYRWNVEGDHIRSYTDISGFTFGLPGSTQFTPGPTFDEDVIFSINPLPSGDDFRWFWKDTGTFVASVEVEVRTPSGQSSLCTAEKSFTVERNQDNPDRQAVDFFTSCCSDSPERVRLEHSTFHDATDEFVPHEGTAWLNLHRAVVETFEQWRAFFGYPALPVYDGATPFPTTENGFNVDDETRATNQPVCKRDVQVGQPELPDLPNCPLPAWYTATGDGSARPFSEVDGDTSSIDDGEEIIVSASRCYRAADYNTDFCKAFDIFPDGPELDEELFDCEFPPMFHEIPSFNIGLNYYDPTAPERYVLRDPVNFNQTKLGDFVDNQELGCLITFTWHLDMHLGVNGSMFSTATSPKDPIFYRMHKLLAGVSVGGGGLPLNINSGEDEPETTGTAFGDWELAMAEGPPGISTRYPIPERLFAVIEEIEVEFWEPVTGVEAGDLIVDGIPATTVAGAGRGPYIFGGFEPLQLASLPTTPENVLPPGKSPSFWDEMLAFGRSFLGDTVLQQEAIAVGQDEPTIVEVVLSSGSIMDLDGNSFSGASWKYRIGVDTDHDRVPDAKDNCPTNYNPLQANSDKLAKHGGREGMQTAIIRPGDELGDRCDPDDDNDGVSDGLEVFLGSDPLNWRSIPENLGGDLDGDGVDNSADGCPTDPNKIEPGFCGCEALEEDFDGDGAFNCVDPCYFDPNKTDPGLCGCGFSDVDSDGDETVDCHDACAEDPLKTEPGVCGCGVPDSLPNCGEEEDLCPDDPNKTDPGVCGCGVPDIDTDGDGTFDCQDECVNDPNKTEPGVCGCNVSDTDSDGDKVPDCEDGCPADPNKIEEGVCGCGIADIDTDGDGTLDCEDECAEDPNKVLPGACGCGVLDVDGDEDGIFDCDDICQGFDDKLDQDGDGTPDGCDGCPEDSSTTNPADCGPENILVRYFGLTNSGTGEEVGQLNNAMEVDLRELQTFQVNVQANTVPEVIGSVKFLLNGEVFRIDNSAPYTLSGEGINFNWIANPGRYNLTAIPYPEANANGEAGDALKVYFSVARVIDTEANGDF